MDRNAAERDMVEGYLDGLNAESPEPSHNRSASYRHGFANGRDDKRREPRAGTALLRQWAEEAITDDTTSPWPVSPSPLIH